MRDSRHAARFSALIGAAILLVVSVHPPQGWGVPICWTRELSGLTCPGCGMLRSMSSTVAGEFSDAWAYHPFGPAVLLIAVGMCARSLLPIRWMDWTAGSTSRLLSAAYAAFVAAFIAFAITRALVVSLPD